MASGYDWDELAVASGEVSRGEKILFSGTDPESYVTDYTLVYEDKMAVTSKVLGLGENDCL